MKKIDVTDIIIEGLDTPYNMKSSLVEVLFNPDQKLNAVELLKRDEIAKKILDCNKDYILLESEEFNQLKRSFDMINSFTRHDVEFVKRILNVEDVEVDVIE